MRIDGGHPSNSSSYAILWQLSIQLRRLCVACRKIVRIDYMNDVLKLRNSSNESARNSDFEKFFSEIFASRRHQELVYSRS